MSIVRKEPLDPSDSLVRISKQEAIELQWKTIFEWKRSSDVWPFRYGVSGLGLCAAASSLYILSFYRRKLGLRHHAKIAMNAPVAALPAIVLPMLHHKLVSESILVQSACPVCIQIRSMVIQSTVGVLYPLVLAPLTGFMYASVFLTYPLPLLKLKNLPELYKTWKNITIPFKNRILVLCLLSSFVAAIVTEFEAKSFFTIQEKILENYKNKY